MTVTMTCEEWDENKYGMSYEQFTRGIEEMRKNTNWMYGHWDELKERYGNQWIAVHREKVAAQAMSMSGLFSKLRKGGFDLKEVLVRYVPPSNVIEIFWVRPLGQIAIDTAGTIPVLQAEAEVGFEQ